jgi:predicted MPP superfamily phosphohydrolase
MTDQDFYALSISTAAALLAYILLWSGLQTFNANPTKRFMRIWLKLALYYAAYTMPVWALLLVIDWWHGLPPMLAQLSAPLILMIVLAMGLYFYTVVVQPNRLRLEHHSVDLDLSTPLTVAVLADLRIGLYSGKPRHIRKLVATINKLSADAVLVTGDWLYYPSADLVGQLMLFKGINKPVYTVMSTSDLRYQSINTTKQGQPLLEDTLASTFDVLDISYIGQQCTSLPLTCAAGNANSQQLSKQSNPRKNDPNIMKYNNLEVNPVVALLCGWQEIPKQLLDVEGLNMDNKAALGAEITYATKPVILLASRFDSISGLPKSPQPRPLLITGAAKVTQKNIWLAQKQKDIQRQDEQTTLLSNSRMAKQRGLYQHGSAQIFVSSGIGTRGLPFRLYRPTIDVLKIR